MSGICERKPDVCEVGKAAMQTIGVRARETARIAYEMLEENAATTPVPPDEVGALIASEQRSGASCRAHRRRRDRQRRSVRH